MIGSRPRTVLVVAGLLLGLGACSSRPYPSDVPEPRPTASPHAARTGPAAANAYTVKAGDTLYSIAFAAGTDWQTLARLNRIVPPYTIYPGQQLTLSASPVPVVLGMEPDVPATATRAPAAPTAPVAPAAPAVTAERAPAAAPPRPLPPPPADPGAWQWPGKGKLLLGFSHGTQPHKGIDIAGSIGDPVLAAKGGTVVYAGNGVRGYGNLLIVKHDALFLSAYAHNSRLLVREGDVVKGGQQIAEMGDSGTDRTKLHFEVRKQGNPVDPLQVLPGR